MGSNQCHHDFLLVKRICTKQCLIEIIVTLVTQMLYTTTIYLVYRETETFYKPNVVQNNRTKSPKSGTMLYADCLEVLYEINGLLYIMPLNVSLGHFKS